ncbi:MAG: BMP family ABC transporter substrate-binding protein [Alphaproteobacteria bacterium]|nr:BMP family ABC transporter substrate-binding protein [Alphaproteobacteria bacterium]
MRNSMFMSRRTLLAGGSALALALSSKVALAGGKIKAAGIFTQPVEQQWDSRLHIALKAAQDRGDIDYVYSESVADNDYERVLRQYAEQKVDFIVGEAFGLERAARKVSLDYPDVAFLMGSSFGPQDPNFSVFDNWIHEPSYLTGMAAGAASKSGVIGMVGGYAIPEVNRLMNAFMNGARELNPDAKFLVNFIGSWYDPPKAKESAFAMIDAGADVMYAERFGVSDAAMERGVKAIGNVIDTAPDYPGTILASAIWHFEPTVDHMVAALKSKQYKADDYGKYSFMKYGGGSIILDETLVPADVVAKIRAKEAAIISGAYTVTVNNDEPKSS